MSTLEVAKQGRDTPRAFLDVATLAQCAQQRLDVPERSHTHRVAWCRPPAVLVSVGGVEEGDSSSAYHYTDPW